MRDEVAGPFILWKDYGSEGWRPYSFPSADTMLSAVQTDGCYGGFIVTKRLELSVQEVQIGEQKHATAEDPNPSGL